MVDTEDESCHTVLKSRTSCQLFLVQELQGTLQGTSHFLGIPLLSSCCCCRGQEPTSCCVSLEMTQGWRWFGGGVLAVGEVGWEMALAKMVSLPLFSHSAPLGVFPACFLYLSKKEGQELPFFSFFISSPLPHLLHCFLLSQVKSCRSEACWKARPWQF